MCLEISFAIVIGSVAKVCERPLYVTRQTARGDISISPSLL